MRGVGSFFFQMRKSERKSNPVPHWCGKQKPPNQRAAPSSGLLAHDRRCFAKNTDDGAGNVWSSHRNCDRDQRQHDRVLDDSDALFVALPSHNNPPNLSGW
jgi:hypothetical protein